MFDKIAAYLEKRVEDNAINPDPFERKQVALAALLVEASRLDGHYDAVEQGTVVRLLKNSIDKLGVKTRSDAALMALRAGWITLDDLRHL